jgi:hypothetical protein
MLPPQLSPTTPQYWPPIGLQLSRFVQLAAGVPQTPVTFAPPQVWGALQLMQSSDPPQPSPIMPQYWPPPAIAQVSGVQPAGTHSPPLQTWPFAQVPQSSERPQPSPIMPQYFAAPPDAQVIAAQLAPPMQMPGFIAPPLQVASPGQVPQSSMPPGQPLPITLQ